MYALSSSKCKFIRGPDHVGRVFHHITTQNSNDPRQGTVGTAPHLHALMHAYGRDRSNEPALPITHLV